MTCIQKKKGQIKRIDCTIIKIPDELWDEIKAFCPKRNHPKLLVDQLCHSEKYWMVSSIFLEQDASGRCCLQRYGSGSTCHRRFQEWVKPDVFKKTWIRLLKSYDDVIGIKWTWQSIDSISIKSPLGGR